MKENKKDNVIVTANDEECKKHWLKFKIPKPLIFIGIFAIFICLALLSYGAKHYTSEFLCESGDSKILIKYRNGKIFSESKGNINFEFPHVKINEYGLDKYLMRINKDFYDMTGELCTIDGEVLELDMFFYDEEDINRDNGLNEEMAEVGNEYYGYIDIPNTWMRDYDPNSNALTFTDGSYYVSIVYDKSIKESLYDYYISRYTEIIKNSNHENINVDDDIINSRQAYRVSYYNSEDRNYYKVYFFDDEEGGIYYITLYGPKDLEKFLFIPESYRKSSRDYR